LATGFTNHINLSQNASERLKNLESYNDIDPGRTTKEPT